MHAGKQRTPKYRKWLFGAVVIVLLLMRSHCYNTDRIYTGRNLSTNESAKKKKKRVKL